MYLIGCAATQRRIGAVCIGVPWSIGAGLFEVVLFDAAVRICGPSQHPAGRDCALCGLCGLRIGESFAGHPLESLDSGTGVSSWR